MMRVDSHQHFWQIDRGDYGWLNAADHPKIARDYLPRDLAPLLAAGRIDRTILVQAAPTESETGFLLELANSTPFVAGVVGWIDFEAAEVAEKVACLANHPKLVGLRPMIQDIADVEWMLRPQFALTFSGMQKRALCFDALVAPRHLPALETFLRRYDGLSVVIDHGAKPDIVGVGLDVWSTSIRRIARTSRALCKLSGLATEAGPDWNAEILKPYVDVLLESFGASRLMWGSDWPVLNEVGDYAGWLNAAETLTAHLSSAECEQIFGGTAATFYGIAA
jgi:L-fuconolactonase